MIDPQQPDYTNTPASARRARYSYMPRADARTDAPIVSIITPYYNTGVEFLETVRNVQEMSFQNWEWIIVDDGSTDLESLERLGWLEQEELRVHVIHQENSGPAAARNRAAHVARGTYLAQLDSDDLIEPTFIEKCLWVLETQPQFAFCNSYSVAFGPHPYLWQHGFQEYEACLAENTVTNHSVIRRTAFLAVGGFDETIVRGHEDWDLWLSLAAAGYWGYTIPEYLTWYRRDERPSRLQLIEGDKSGATEFRKWLKQKHASLRRAFPHPKRTPYIHQAYPAVLTEIPITNPLAKPPGVTRVLFLIPWMVVGGADKLNLDLMRVLSPRGYEFTVVTTVPSEQAWQHEFAAISPDIFCMDRFLIPPDYPRFLTYLIDSRDIDAILISNSELAYMLVPFLRAHKPSLAFLDYNHLEEPHWKNGGFPAMSVRAGNELDVHVTNTDNLKQWLIEHGADADTIEVCYANIDTDNWDPERHDIAVIRASLDVPQDMPLILFVGRVVEQKRPLMLAEIIRRLAQRGARFTALVVGTGDRLPEMQTFVRRHKLNAYVRFMGTLPNDQVQALMAASDILLLPSAAEGLALVLYECMAMRTVPIAANVGGHAELVTSNCGILIDQTADEIDAYVDAVKGLLQEPERRERMANLCRRRVIDEFDLRHFGDGMDAAFHKARDMARCRTTDAYARTVGKHMAHLAVEYCRMSEVADMLWPMRTSGGLGLRTSVSLKRRILPFGSRRHESYKRVRFTVQNAVTETIQRLVNTRNPPSNAAEVLTRSSGRNSPHPKQLETAVPIASDSNFKH